MGLLAMGFTMPQGDESDKTDPYSLQTVGFELRIRSGGLYVVHSWTQKRLARLGDAVGIALLKILSTQDMQSLQTVKGLLPIVRDAFAQPDFISVESDKNPKVTLFLLDYLRHKVSDAQTLRDTEETIAFVKEKTST
jgi:hypothetical protein